MGLILFMAGMQWGGYQVSRIQTKCQSWRLITTTVPMVLRSRSCSLAHWRLSSDWFLLLGDVGHQTMPQTYQLEPRAYVSRANQTRSTSVAADSFDHVYQWSKLFRSYHVLAFVFPIAPENGS